MAVFIAFTVCTRAQLAPAYALGDSLRRWHPDAFFFIGLADAPLPVDAPYRVVPVTDLPEIDVGGLSARYTHTEFARATRPFFARYALGAFAEAERLVFLAPETALYAPLNELLIGLDGAALVLLPQLLAPPTDRRWPDEKHFLNVGVYQSNLWGLRRSAEARRFLDWWASRLRTQGWLRLCEGYGSDQLWLCLVPAFFENVLTLRNPGYGLHVGNATERNLKPAGTGWQADGQPLVTICWEGLRPDATGWADTRTDRPLPPPLRRLAQTYSNDLKAQPAPPGQSPSPAFGQPDPPAPASVLRRRLARPLRWMVQWVDTFQPDFLFK